VASLEELIDERVARSVAFLLIAVIRSIPCNGHSEGHRGFANTDGALERDCTGFAIPNTFILALYFSSSIHCFVGFTLSWFTSRPRFFGGPMYVTGSVEA
jgi:ABC-type Fe3+ transport system permease subunit